MVYIDSSVNAELPDISRYRRVIDEYRGLFTHDREVLKNEEIINLMSAAIHIHHMLEDIIERHSVYRELEQRAYSHVEQRLPKSLLATKEFFSKIVEKSNSYNLWDLIGCKRAKSIRVLFDDYDKYPLTDISSHFDIIFDVFDGLDWIDHNIEEVHNRIIGFTGESSSKCFQIRFPRDGKNNILEYSNDSYAWFGTWSDIDRCMYFKGYTVYITRSGVFISSKDVVISVDRAISEEWLSEYMRKYVPESFI